MTSDLVKKVEAILFYKSEPVSVRELAKLSDAAEPEIDRALEELKSLYADRGITLMQEGLPPARAGGAQAGDRYMFATAPSVADFIKKLVQEEYTKDLGKAGLETLAVVLYRGPVARTDIDHIRGVNSSFILRALVMRGLVERLPNERDSRSFLYRPSFDLLRHLGVANVKDLPEFESVKEAIDAVPKEEADETTTQEDLASE